LTLLKFASPGVPDVYQGTELMALTLVDPDNRGPVDYELRSAWLSDFERTPGHGGALAKKAQALVREPGDGRAKLWFAWRLLALRRAEAAFFRDAGYRGLRVTGPLSRHVVAFARESGDRMLVVVASRFFAAWSGAGAEPLPPELPVGEKWNGTQVLLPGPCDGEGADIAPPAFVELLAGERFSCAETDTAGMRGPSASIDLARLFARMPWAALWRTGRVD